MPERDEDDDGTRASGTALEPRDDMVQFYDPTDLFGDLAETLAEQYPEVAPDEDEETVTEPRRRRGRAGLDVTGPDRPLS